LQIYVTMFQHYDKWKEFRDEMKKYFPDESTLNRAMARLSETRELINRIHLPDSVCAWYRMQIKT